MDGWYNVVSGLGMSSLDKRTNNQLQATGRLNETLLNNLYREDPIAARIIDLVADEMTREWITIEGDSDNFVVEMMQEIRAKQIFNNAIKWARLHGGSLVVAGLMDGKDMKEPLDIDQLDSVDFLEVYDHWRVDKVKYVTQEDVDNGEEKLKDLGLPKIYRVDPVNVSSARMHFTVHHSRVLRFFGKAVVPKVKEENNGWEDSEIKGTYEAIRDLTTAHHHVANIIEEFVVSVIKMKNLAHLITSGKDAVVRKRLEQLDLSKSVLRMVAIDEEEEYTKQGSPITGIDEAVDRLERLVSAGHGIPITLLMGRSPAGMNATGESDIRNFYDMIAGKQEINVEPQVRRLTEWLMMSKDGKFNGTPPEDWKVILKPLRQQTESEKVTMREVQSKTDEKYISLGVLTTEEVARSRFSGNSYSIETELDFERSQATEESLLPESGDEDDPDNKDGGDE